MLMWVTSSHPNTISICTMLFDVEEAKIQTRCLFKFSSFVLDGQMPHYVYGLSNSGLDPALLELEWLERLRWEAYCEFCRRIASPSDNDFESESDILEDLGYTRCRLECLDDKKFATHIAFVLKAIDTIRKHKDEVYRLRKFKQFDSLELSCYRSIRQKMPFE